MYLLLTDETNQQPSDSIKFFIYGGIIIPEESFVALDDGIAAIRNAHGFKSTDEFKFDTRTRPEYVSQEEFSKAKAELVALCINLKVQFIVYIIHHEIQKNQEMETRLEWAADYVIGRFNQFLDEKNDFGFCIIDNLPVKSQYKYLARKFTEGHKLDSGTVIHLSNIKLFATTCSNASNYSSAMDIVLGSFRYCINNPKNKDAASDMIVNVAKMMWGEYKDSKYYVIGQGLIFRPEIKDIKSVKLQAEYKELLASMNKLMEKSV